jgi:hypothetical protein
MALNSAEREVVREIAYSEEVVGTDLNPEALERKIENIRPRFHHVANQNETISYSEVTDGFSVVHRFRIGTVLGIIGALERELDNPLLPAVVFKKQGHGAGEGFLSLLSHLGMETPSAETTERELWKEHLEEVYAHDW